MAEWGEGRRQWEKPPAISPLRFLNLCPLFGRNAFWTAFLIDQQNVNLSADVRFPVDTNFKGIPSVVMGLAASDLICVRSKKNSLSGFDTLRSFVVPKRQKVILKSKRAVSERKIFLKRRKIISLHVLVKTTQVNSRLASEICVC